MKSFPIKILASDELDGLSIDDPVASITTSPNNDLRGRLLESHMAGDPANLILFRMKNEQEDWPHLLSLITLKNTLAIATKPNTDKETLINDLVRQGVAPDDAALVISRASRQHLPHIMVRVNDPALAETLRRAGGIDAVITEADDLHCQYQAAKSVIYNRAQPEHMTGEELAASIAERQDYIDLRKLEKISIDTELSLRHILDAIKLYEDATGSTPKWILEAGVGEGRIAIPLLLMGYNVIGIDASDKRLAKARKRLHSEADLFLSGTPPEDSLSAIVTKLFPENRHKPNIADIDTRFITEQMEIQQFGGRLAQTLAERPEMAIFAWNTLNFMGGPDQMLRVLRQMYDTLPKNGVLYIEVPNPEEEPYASMLAKFYAEHPERPPGFFQARAQAKGGELYASDKEKPGALRYYPTREELRLLLELAGFEIAEMSEETIVPNGQGLSNKKITELYITAIRK